MSPLLSHDVLPVAGVGRGESRETMSVLVTVPDLRQPGGVVHYYTTLRRHLAREVKYFAVGARVTGGRRSFVWGRLLQDYWRFYRQLCVQKPGLVHLNPSLQHKALLRDGVFLLIAKLLGHKVVVFVRGWSSACEDAIRRRYLFLFRPVYLRADAFVVLASRFRSVLRDLGYHRPVYVETTVVPEEAFRHGTPRDTPSAAQSRRVRILFLARIEKAKGIYEAIDAFRLVRAKYPLVTLTVAGAGSELAAAREYAGAKGMPGVRFVGWLAGSKKREAFAHADIYLFPSWHPEGMPNCVLEAMAQGLPVVTRSVGGLADFFEEGLMGFMTDSRDPAVFAALLEKLILDPNLRRAMGQYNHAYARQRFAASMVAARLVEIYRRTMHDEESSCPPAPVLSAPGADQPSGDGGELSRAHPLTTFPT
jgi:glycosyltransferase involved in cell wall biosynthesis